MALECIHGFEAGMCDSCFPKKAPEVTTPPKRAAPRTAGSSTPRGQGLPGSTRQKTGTAAAAAAAKKAVDLGAQRIFHVTHISNLPAIIVAGAILAPSTTDADGNPIELALDISSEVTRELRRTAEVAGGEMVSDFVPFYLSPDATNWVELLSGAQGVHWSDEARAANPTDFVVLAGTLGAIAASGAQVVVSDGDAAGSVTRFASNPEAVDRMLRRLLDDEFSLITAEVLAPGSYPLADVALIGVANDRTRDAVKALLKGTGASPKVAVYPPWFVPSLGE